MVFVGTPKCTGCGEVPVNISEYVDAAEDFNYLNPNDYVRMEEGTYNDTNGHFLCTPCYINAGAPSSPTGWVAP